jgi:hypothetical protein
MRRAWEAPETFARVIAGAGIESGRWWGLFQGGEVGAERMWIGRDMNGGVEGGILSPDSSGHG